MRKIIPMIMLLVFITTSCVSKKKYLALDSKLTKTKDSLKKETEKKEELEEVFSKVDKKINAYNEKINKLRNISTTFEKENNVKFDVIDNSIVISNSVKEKMKETLKEVDPSVLANAKTLKDSINIAIAHNLKKSINSSEFSYSDEFNIDIDKAVIMISVSDNVLFNTGSYRIKRKAYRLIKKIVKIIKAESSIDVLVEGHADSRPIETSILKDNWDLSVKRATSIVRMLENRFRIEPSRLIASGRGSSVPYIDNKTWRNRARNRRTRIVLMPNLDKFFGLLVEEILKEETRKKQTIKRVYIKNRYLQFLRKNFKFDKNKKNNKCINNGAEEDCKKKNIGYEPSRR